MLIILIQSSFNYYNWQTWEDCQVLQWKRKWIREVGWGTSRGVAHDAIGPCCPGWTQDRNELGSHCPPAPDQRTSPTLPAVRATILPCSGSASPQGVPHRYHGCLLSSLLFSLLLTFPCTRQVTLSLVQLWLPSLWFQKAPQAPVLQSDQQPWACQGSALSLGWTPHRNEFQSSKPTLMESDF